MKNYFFFFLIKFKNIKKIKKKNCLILAQSFIKWDKKNPQQKPKENYLFKEILNNFLLYTHNPKKAVIKFSERLKYLKIYKPESKKKKKKNY